MNLCLVDFVVILLVEVGVLIVFLVSNLVIIVVAFVISKTHGGG
jgi:hypothetical protein